MSSSPTTSIMSTPDAETFVDDEPKSDCNGVKVRRAHVDAERACVMRAFVRVQRARMYSGGAAAAAPMQTSDAGPSPHIVNTRAPLPFCAADADAHASPRPPLKSLDARARVEIGALATALLWHLPRAKMSIHEHGITVRVANKFEEDWVWGCAKAFDSSTALSYLTVTVESVPIEQMPLVHVSSIEDVMDPSAALHVALDAIQRSAPWITTEFWHVPSDDASISVSSTERTLASVRVVYPQFLAHVTEMIIQAAQCQIPHCPALRHCAVHQNPPRFGDLMMLFPNRQAASAAAEAHLPENDIVAVDSESNVGFEACGGNAPAGVYIRYAAHAALYLVSCGHGMPSKDASAHVQFDHAVKWPLIARVDPDTPKDDPPFELVMRTTNVPGEETNEGLQSSDALRSTRLTGKQSGYADMSLFETTASVALSSLVTMPHTSCALHVRSGSTTQQLVALPKWSAYGVGLMRLHAQRDDIRPSSGIRIVGWAQKSIGGKLVIVYLAEATAFVSASGVHVPADGIGEGDSGGALFTTGGGGVSEVDAPALHSFMRSIVREESTKRSYYCLTPAHFVLAQTAAILMCELGDLEFCVATDDKEHIVGSLSGSLSPPVSTGYGAASSSERATRC